MAGAGYLLYDRSMHTLVPFENLPVWPIKENVKVTLLGLLSEDGALKGYHMYIVSSKKTARCGKARLVPAVQYGLRRAQSSIAVVETLLLHGSKHIGGCQAICVFSPHR